MTYSRISKSFESTSLSHPTFSGNIATSVFPKQKSGKPKITSSSPVISKIEDSTFDQSPRYKVQTLKLRASRKCANTARGQDFTFKQLCNPNFNDCLTQITPNSIPCSQPSSSRHRNDALNSITSEKYPHINWKIKPTRKKFEWDIARSSSTSLSKELEQSRKEIEDPLPTKKKYCPKIQMLSSNVKVSQRDEKARGTRPMKVRNGAETQMLVNSLELQVEKLKRELIGRDLAWNELQDSYKSLRSDTDSVISRNINLGAKVSSLMKVRQKEDKAYINMKYQMGQVNKNYLKVNKSKSRIIEDQNRKYVKWKAKYTELARQCPEKMKVTVERQQKALSQSHQKVRDIKDMYKKQLGHLNQKEEQLSRAKNELRKVKNDMRVMRTELLLHQQGDGVREEIQSASKSEVARLSAELASQKTKTELIERNSKEKEARLLRIERRLREQLKETTQKLHITITEAERNLIFFERQAKIHEKIKKEHLHDLSLIEKGRSAEVEDLRREINEWKDKVVPYDRKAKTCTAIDNHETSSKSECRVDVNYVEKVNPVTNGGTLKTPTTAVNNGSQLCEKFLTSTEIARVQEIQHNLEVIANLVFCCVNGKIPENTLLEASSCEDGYPQQGILNEEGLRDQKCGLSAEDFTDFKNSINNLLLDVRRLRSYIAKKYAGELTEQCYVQ